jgi:L-cysteine desulfidase
VEELTRLIRSDMRPALGVTEPGAIAFAAAKARSYTSGEVISVTVKLNSGMYKNAFTCGIPNSREVGSEFAAALGAIAGNEELGLESLSDVKQKDAERAEKLVKQGKVQVILQDISSRIFIEVEVKTKLDQAVVTIEDTHTNITGIVVNGEVRFANSKEKTKGGEAEEKPQIHRYTFRQLCEYADIADVSELEFIWEAYRVNLELFEAGMTSERTTFAKSLLRKNGGMVFSGEEQKTASLFCNAAIEARVIGLDKPAMSITGSGAHGIIATMPLYAAYKVNGYSKEQLLRATALSYLICMYIKEYSGKLSAFCGCAIAAGTGMACALVYLRGGTVEMMEHTINNMAGYYGNDLRWRKSRVHDERDCGCRCGISIGGACDGRRLY